MDDSEAATAPEVSVVVATHRRPTRLAALLGSLERQTVDPSRFEVVVVDDASGDETADVLQARRASTPITLGVRSQPASRGPAAARNAGWRAASAPLIAFTDDDCEPDPGWLEALLAATAATPGVAIQGRTEPIPRELAEDGPFSRTLSVNELGPYFPTCNMAYPRSVLESLDGFDEGYPAPGGEDTDLAWRAKRDEGIEIVFAPDALVHHAVNQYGPIGKLRWALHWSDAMKVFSDHPEVRGALRWGFVWKEEHGRLLLALAGLLLARRARAGLLLALPYAYHLRGRSRFMRGDSLLAPYLVVYDLAETFATLRGAVRYRVLVV